MTNSLPEALRQTADALDVAATAIPAVATTPADPGAKPAFPEGSIVYTSEGVRGRVTRVHEPLFTETHRYDVAWADGRTTRKTDPATFDPSWRDV